MPRLNKIKLALSVSLFGLLVSCSVRPPNILVFEALEQRLTKDPKTGHLLLSPSPACMRAVGEPECLHGVAILSGDEVYVGEAPKHRLNGKPASQLRNEMIMLPAEESYAPLQSYVINACREMKCDDQVSMVRIRLGKLKAAASAGRKQIVETVIAPVSVDMFDVTRDRARFK